MTLLPSQQILSWLEDETLFSLVSRHHALSGAVRSRDTCERFFGHPRSGSQHDLPCNLDSFVARTGRSLGDAASIIRDRTLLPYYLPFRNDRVATEAIATLRGPAVGSLKYQLGILTSRFRANHPLKACRLCMKGDVDRHGVAYWHRMHQFPGVWWCHIHDEPLRESAVKANGVEQFFWHLPSTSTLAVGEKGRFQHVSDASSRRLSRLGQLTQDYISWGGRIDEVRLLSAYHHALNELGLLSPAGGLKLTPIAEQFRRHVGPLRCMDELQHLPGDDQAAAAQVGRLLRVARTGTHPVRHLILIDWLFGDWPSFLQLYEGVQDWVERAPSPISPPPCTADINRDRAINALKNGSIALSEAARIAGVDIATAAGWARQAGVEVRPRPKVLHPDRLAAVHIDLLRGNSTADVAQTHKLSVPTINRILRADPGVGAKAREARANCTRATHRKAWNQAASEQPSLSTQALRTLIPACYAWLYRHDRHWLRNATDNLPPAPAATTPRVDWLARDAELATLVERTILQLSIERPNQPIQLWRIYQRAPHLKAKLGHLDRLPLTRRAIELAVTRRRSRSTKDLLS